MTTTGTRIFTRLHTATHLSGAIAGFMIEVLTDLGVSARSLASDWYSDYDPAIRTWIEEGSLSQVVLECVQPGGTTEPIFEFPIDYYTDGSAEFTHRQVALARLTAKLTRVAAGTTYRIICQYSSDHSYVPGWGPTARASTAGLRSITLGTLAAGPHAGASVRAYTR